jgi:hypothetical protein
MALGPVNKLKLALAPELACKFAVLGEELGEEASEVSVLDAGETIGAGRTKATVVPVEAGSDAPLASIFEGTAVDPFVP